MMYVVVVTTKTTVFVEAKDEKNAREVACVIAPLQEADSVDAKVIDSYED